MACRNKDNPAITKFHRQVTPFDKFVSHVAVEGHPFAPAEFINGQRCDSNVTGAQLLPLEFDNATVVDGNKVYAETFTIAQALTDPFIQQYAALIYTTPSHAPGWDRFRIIFLLPEKANKKDAALMLAHLHRLYPGADQSGNSVARFFFGCQNAEIPLRNDEARLPSDFLDQAQRGQAAIAEQVKVSAPATPVTGELIDRVREALTYIPQRVIGGGNYGDCRRVLAALANTFDLATAIELAEAWSPSQPKWDVPYKVESFTKKAHSTPITINTLFWIAQQHGYKSTGGTFTREQRKAWAALSPEEKEDIRQTQRAQVADSVGLPADATIEDLVLHFLGLLPSQDILYPPTAGVPFEFAHLPRTGHFPAHKGMLVRELNARLLSGQRIALGCSRELALVFSQYLGDRGIGHLTVGSAIEDRDVVLSYQDEPKRFLNSHPHQVLIYTNSIGVPFDGANYDACLVLSNDEPWVEAVKRIGLCQKPKAYKLFSATDRASKLPSPIWLSPDKQLENLQRTLTRSDRQRGKTIDKLGGALAGFRPSSNDAWAQEEAVRRAIEYRDTTFKAFLVEHYLTQQGIAFEPCDIDFSTRDEAKALDRSKDARLLIHSVDVAQATPIELNEGSLPKTTAEIFGWLKHQQESIVGPTELLDDATFQHAHVEGFFGLEHFKKAALGALIRLFARNPELKAIAETQDALSLLQKTYLPSYELPDEAWRGLISDALLLGQCAALVHILLNPDEKFSKRSPLAVEAWSWAQKNNILLSDLAQRYGHQYNFPNWKETDPTVLPLKRLLTICGEEVNGQGTRTQHGGDQLHGILNDDALQALVASTPTVKNQRRLARRQYRKQLEEAATTYYAQAIKGAQFIFGQCREELETLLSKASEVVPIFSNKSNSVPTFRESEAYQKIGTPLNIPDSADNSDAPPATDYPFAA